MSIEDFIKEHSRTVAAETANEHRFVLGLSELLNLPKPEGTVADETKNLFVFQKAVKFNNDDGTTSDGRIGLYKAGCFVRESKQGADAKALVSATKLLSISRLKLCWESLA